MTGPSGNRLSEIQDRLPNRNSWGRDPESLGANRSAYYPRDQSLFVYYLTLGIQGALKKWRVTFASSDRQFFQTP